MKNGFAQRMPRYYRLKIFSEYERMKLAEEQVAESDRMYWKEYARLFDLGIEDPDLYMEESGYIESLKVGKKAKERMTL